MVERIVKIGVMVQSRTICCNVSIAKEDHFTHRMGVLESLNGKAFHKIQYYNITMHSGEHSKAYNIYRNAYFGLDTAAH